MGSKKTTLSVLIAMLTLAGSAIASETIYKWTDENGNVHYGDRPSGAPTEERLTLTFRRTDSAAVQQRMQARLDRQATRDETRTAEEAARQDEAEQAAAASGREQACIKARERLQSYVQARRLYRTDDNGERVYLDDAQREEARRKAEEKVSEFCS
jgi:hypothetical protein